MNAEGALLELATLNGIEPGYHDIWGTWHPLSRDTAVAVLEAMGVHAGDDAAQQRALADAHARAGHTLLEPVAVAREDEPFRLVLHTAAALAGHTAHWSLHREDGSEASGQIRIAEIELLEEHDSADGVMQRRRLELAPACPPGYHSLRLRVGERVAHSTLIRAPRTCHGVPRSAQGARPWGVAVQLYGLRSQHNWGIGDFGDLGRAVDVLAALGADLVGLNPLHALLPSSPDHVSPYSPSSRRFLNPAYLQVEAIADFDECDAVRENVAHTAFQAQLERLRASALVDYEQAIPLKLGVLRRLYRHFREHHLEAGSARAQALLAFREAQGDALRRHAIFEALQARLGADRDSWPPALRDPDGDAVRRFADAHDDEVGFAEYLQWQTALQLDAAARRARAQGMRIGLYLDLAVGSDGFGADVWAQPSLHAGGISVGAPPDDFSLEGQVWGLPPWSPRALRERAYAPFAAALRAVMSPAGALRIDHVLGLLRQFWVPAGGSAADGAYVNYPVHDLLAVAALESRRARCVVVGEDLGTVPDAIRGALADSGVLSYRVLYFEKHWHGDHSFRAPQDYPEQALVTLSTHDLATFAGFWTGHDLDLRSALSLFPDDRAEASQRETRQHDRWRLLDALGHEGLRPEPIGEPGAGPPGERLVRAVHRFLARSPSAILCVQMEDVLGEVEQVNVPGTVTAHPNWRRKLALPVEAWSEHAPLRELAQAVCRERAGDGSQPV